MQWELGYDKGYAAACSASDIQTSARLTFSFITTLLLIIIVTIFIVSIIIIMDVIYLAIFLLNTVDI